MLLVQIEYLFDPSRPTTWHRLSRVPGLGEVIAIGDATYVAHCVIHVADVDPEHESVAYVRVTR